MDTFHSLDVSTLVYNCTVYLLLAGFSWTFCVDQPYVGKLYTFSMMSSFYGKKLKVELTQNIEIECLVNYRNYSTRIFCHFLHVMCIIPWL